MNRILTCVLLVLIMCTTAFSQVQHAENQSQLATSIDSVMKEVTAVGGDFVYDESKMVAIPKTNIRIQPPEYFKYSESIPGFMHVGTLSSIQVEEVVGTSYEIIAMAMDSAYFASQGMRLISSEQIVMHDGSTGMLFTAEMKISGYIFERLILMSGDYNFTMWITAAYIKLLAPKVKNVIIQSMLTSKIYE